MKTIRRTTIASGVALCLTATCVNAALITTAAPLAPSTVIDFQQFTSVNLANAVPVQVGSVVGEDVELYGYGSYSTFVGPVSHSLGGNGSWNSTTNSNFYSVRLPVSTATAFEFVLNDGPVSGVGGFMNYAPGYGPVLIEAYDAGGVLLESHTISAVAPISTPGALNDGAFRGILRSSADISAFRVSGGYAVLDNLTFNRVPEPASALLLGLSGIVTLNQRFRRAS